MCYQLFYRKPLSHIEWERTNPEGQITQARSFVDLFLGQGGNGSAAASGMSVGLYLVHLWIGEQFLCVNDILENNILNIAY